MFNLIYLPYTYRIFHVPTQRYYYGSKTSNYKGNIANPRTFWKEGGYFTSSKIVKQLIKIFGRESFIIQRIKTFGSKEEARLWEATFLQRIDAAHRSNWINQVNNDGKFVNFGHSDETKFKLKKNHKGMQGKKHSEERNIKYNNYLKEHGHPALGYHHTDEAKQKIGDYWRGKHRGKHTEEHQKNLSNALKGRKVSEERRKQMSELAKKQWAEGRFRK